MATAKKAALKTSAAAVVPGPESEAVPDLEPRAIVVKGRSIRTKRPTAEQLMIVEEVFSEITRKERSGDYESGKQLIKDFHRVTRGLFVDPADSEWFDDGRYTGEVSLYDEETLRIPEKIVEVWRDAFPNAPANRVAKRAAARRKA